MNTEINAAMRDSRAAAYSIWDEALWRELFAESGAPRLLVSELFEGNSPALADNPLRNFKNRFIIICSAASYFAVRFGMPPLMADTLCAELIRGAEECDSLDALEERMLELPGRFRQEDMKWEGVPYIIYKVDNYIDTHYQQQISIKQISEHVGLNPSYLCTAYKKAAGRTILESVQKRKIRAAKGLLHRTDSSCVEISNILSFSSNSYFIKVFKRETGMTPMQFRRRSYISSNL